MTLRESGSLTLPFGWADRVIYAGPWANRPRHVMGVKLAPEVEGFSRWYLPIRDFSIPLNTREVDRILRDVLWALAFNTATPVYVGCYGGKGRTGLFLALLAKCLGVKDPVAYVRKHYRPEAVETEQQRKFVAEYQPPYSCWAMASIKACALVCGLVPVTPRRG